MNNKNSVVVLGMAIIFGTLSILHISEPQSAAAGQPETTQTPERNVVNFTVLTSAELAAMLSQKEFFLVNVHIPYEGEIKNTDAFIEYDKIADNLDKLPTDRNAKIVLYCRSGRMSEIAARELTRLGYTRVSDLFGGMIDWKKSGYEVIEK